MFQLVPTADMDKCGQLVALPMKDGFAVTAYTTAARAKGYPVILIPGYTAGQELVATIASSGVNAIPCLVGIAVDNVAATSIGLWQITGRAEALVYDTSTLAAGAMLELLTATSVAGLTTAASTSLADHTAAVLVDAVTAAENSGSPVLKTVILNPVPHNCESS